MSSIGQLVKAFEKQRCLLGTTEIVMEVSISIISSRAIFKILTGIF